MATNMKNICLRPEFSYKLADVLEALSASIAVIIETASISETFVYMRLQGAMSQKSVIFMRRFLADFTSHATEHH